MRVSVRSQANLHFDKENVEQRQRTLESTYDRLSSLAQQRHDNLDDAISFYRFCRECDSFEKWMSDKQQIMMQKESLSENMEAVKRRFGVSCSPPLILASRRVNLNYIIYCNPHLATCKCTYCSVMYCV